jgi:hypothetical protein
MVERFDGVRSEEFVEGTIKTSLLVINPSFTL